MRPPIDEYSPRVVEDHPEVDVAWLEHHKRFRHAADRRTGRRYVLVELARNRMSEPHRRCDPAPWRAKPTARNRSIGACRSASFSLRNHAGRASPVVQEAKSKSSLRDSSRIYSRSLKHEPASGTTLGPSAIAWNGRQMRGNAVAGPWGGPAFLVCSNRGGTLAMKKGKRIGPGSRRRGARLIFISPHK